MRPDARSTLVVSGYASGVLLLVTVGFFAWVELVLPAWVLVLSVYVLVAGFRRGKEVEPGAAPDSVSAS